MVKYTVVAAGLLLSILSCDMPTIPDDVAITIEAAEDGQQPARTTYTATIASLTVSETPNPLSRDLRITYLYQVQEEGAPVAWLTITIRAETINTSDRVEYVRYDTVGEPALGGLRVVEIPIPQDHQVDSVTILQVVTH